MVRTTQANVHDETWLSLLQTFHGDDKPWLLIPGDPVSSGACESISRAQLADRALRVAAGLSELGGRAGDRVVVIADNSPECCVLLIGVLAAGMVAVPVAPRAIAARSGGRRTAAVVADCDARFLTGSAEALDSELADLTVKSSLVCCSLDELVEAGGSEACAHPSASDLALIQYTSGTTSRPRGVELTHENLFANLEGIRTNAGLEPGEVALCWLPLFHDMGLIGTLLSSTLWRVPMVLMTPASFALCPESWLWAVSRFRVASCAAPNSAYHLCATRLPQERLKGLDLSSWRLAFNGAEQVQTATIDAFCRRFEPYGFRREAMYPVYGLAEHTVAATLGDAHEAPRADWVERGRLEADGVAVAQQSGEGLGIVSVGRAMAGHALRVVDRHTGQQAPDRVVGSVELKGRCVMRGYHGLEGETARVLSADGWLATGDQGYLVDGELYIVGRTKDVVKRAGRTYYASDIAAAVQTVQGVRYGSVAVFGVPDEATGTDGLVIVAETRVKEPAARARLESDVGAALRRVFGLSARGIVLAPPRSVPRTTSGKVQHSLAAEQYLAGRLPVGGTGAATAGMGRG
ncbi:MAG: AMP-binding protein [Myxococcales bacterium]|nr:AMP-binding protein [Myxococcales bacterium]